MKTVARRYPTSDSPLVTIHDLVRMRQAVLRRGDEWENRAFYPLAGDTPMIAVFPEKNRPHFRFQHREGEGQRVHGGEGIVHELTKYEICLAKRLRLPIYGRPHTFVFTAMTAERCVRAGKTRYYVDVIGRFNEPAELAQDFDHCLVIEICDTHPLDDDKINDLRAVNLATIELSLPANLHVVNDADLTGAEIAAKRVEIRKFLSAIESKNVRMKHHPRWEVHEAKERAAQAAMATPPPAITPTLAPSPAPVSSPLVRATPPTPKPAPLRPVTPPNAVPSPRPAAAPLPAAPVPQTIVRPLAPVAEKTLLGRVRQWWHDLWAA